MSKSVPIRSRVRGFMYERAQDVHVRWQDRHLVADPEKQAEFNRAYGRHLKSLSEGRHRSAVLAARNDGQRATVEILPIEGGFTWRCPCGCRTPESFRTETEAKKDFDDGHGQLLRAAEEQEG